MSKREEFIKFVENLIDYVNDLSIFNDDDNIKIALEYFEEFKNNKTKEKVELTENGAKILNYMHENRKKYNNIFKAKEIGEGLFMSGRSVSGSMRKLISEGFVEKIGSDPVTYAITDLGIKKDI
jgi:hypothetical protein